MRYLFILFILCLATPVQADTLIVTSGLLQTFGDEIGISVAGDNFRFAAPGEHGITPLSMGVVGLAGETVQIFGVVGTQASGQLFGASYPDPSGACLRGLPIRCASINVHFSGSFALPTVEVPVMNLVTPVNVSIDVLIDGGLPNPGTYALLADGLATVTLFGGNAACVTSFCYQVGNLSVSLHAPSVPEPSSLVLLLSGLIPFAAYRRRHR